MPKGSVDIRDSCRPTLFNGVNSDLELRGRMLEYSSFGWAMIGWTLWLAAVWRLAQPVTDAVVVAPSRVDLGPRVQDCASPRADRSGRLAQLAFMHEPSVDSSCVLPSSRRWARTRPPKASPFQSDRARTAVGVSESWIAPVGHTTVMAIPLRFPESS